jgi:hypothetical protein
VAWSGVVDGHVAALGGLTWRFNRCDIWLEVWDPDAISARTIVTQARRMLMLAVQMGEATIYCFRDEHLNSAKLLGLIGLKFDHTEEVGFEDGSGAIREIWAWQPSEPSQQSPRSAAQ